MQEARALLDSDTGSTLTFSVGEKLVVHLETEVDENTYDVSGPTGERGFVPRSVVGLVDRDYEVRLKSRSIHPACWNARAAMILTSPNCLSCSGA